MEAGKSWTVDNLIKKHEDDRRKAAAANGHEEATANGHGGAAVFKVKLVGVSSVKDLVNAFAVALGVPSPGDDSTFKLFSSRVLGNEQGVSSDMKNLRHLLDLVENLAKEKRKPEQNPNSSSKTDKLVAKSARNNSPKNWDEERMVILIVDDMNSINFSENDRRLIDATSMMVQRFEDWARASLIRTVLVSSDHTIVDRVPRLHPSNPLIKPFAFNDLTKNEALDFLAERINGETLMKLRTASMEKDPRSMIIDAVGTNLLHLRQVAQELNRLPPLNQEAYAKTLTDILKSQQNKSCSHLVDTFANVKDESGNPLTQTDIVKLVRILHFMFCDESTSGKPGADWRVQSDFSTHPDYNFIRRLLPQLVSNDILVYYNAGTSKALSLNSKLEWVALKEIHDQYRKSGYMGHLQIIREYTRIYPLPRSFW